MTTKYDLAKMIYESKVLENKDKLKLLNIISEISGEEIKNVGKDLAKEFKSSLVGIAAGAAAATFVSKMKILKDELAECHKSKKPVECIERLNKKIENLKKKNK